MTDSAEKKQKPGFEEEETKRHQKEQQSINDPSVEESNTRDDQIKKPSQGDQDVESDEEQTRDQRKAS